MTDNVAKRRLLQRFWYLGLLFGPFVGFPAQHPGQRASVEISLERVERVSLDEIHFQVKVTNRSDTSIFLTAINYALLGVKDEPRPRPYPIYLEQWRGKEGWKTVTPCMDTPPPHVMKLDPTESLIEDGTLKVPLGGVCKERTIQLEGKFRFRVNYFERAEQARAYLKKFFSQSWQEAHAAVALSEPFEIPPFHDQPGAKLNH